MNPSDLLILSLAAWRLAFFITRESGPFDMASAFRARLPLGGLTSCIFCASFWTAALMYALMGTPLAPVVYVFAASGAALMLASYSGVHHL